MWIGRACISHIVSSQPLVSASWSSPRLFAAFFRLIQSDKTFAVFRFGRLLFFHIFLPAFSVRAKQSFKSTTGRIFPRLLNISPLQILFCGPFLSVLVVVCGAYENPPRRNNRPTESLTHSAGEIHGGEGGGGVGGLIISCGMCGFPVPQQ